MDNTQYIKPIHLYTKAQTNPILFLFYFIFVFPFVVIYDGFRRVRYYRKNRLTILEHGWKEHHPEDFTNISFQDEDQAIVDSKNYKRIWKSAVYSLKSMTVQACGSLHLMSLTSPSKDFVYDSNFIVRFYNRQACFVINTPKGEDLIPIFQKLEDTALSRRDIDSKSFVFNICERWPTEGLKICDAFNKWVLQQYHNL